MSTSCHLNDSLHRAIRSFQYEEVRTLLGENGDFPNALKLVLQQGNCERLKQLLQENEALIEPTLICAIVFEEVEIADTILSQRSGMLPSMALDLAALHGGHISILECLYKHGWDTNSDLEYFGALLGHAIESQSKPEVAIWLLEHGADPIRPQGYSSTVELPLEIASESNASPDIMRLLIKKGATVNGCRALCVAASEGHIDMLRFLIEEGGADVNLLSSESSSTPGGRDMRTALHAAAEEGQEASIRCLLKEGAKKDIRNSAGFLPKEVAERAGHVRCAQLLDL